ncbi:MAG TPA: CRTAC1 family protein [Bryobacteraceae bacterium]|nr:CRTAC1 family protein [Bryobacteraceae bacterium]
MIESIGGGCAFLDYNRDGKLDILLVRGTTLEGFARGGDPVVSLYENQGGGTFRDVSAKAGLEAARGWGMGVTVADYDNDGWPDFLVTGLGRNFLFHNEGNGAFRETARAAGLDRQGVWSTGAAFGDLDLDGKLDVYIAAYVHVDPRHLPARGSGANCLYKGTGVFCGPRGLAPEPHALFHNLGNGKFEDITRSSGIAASAPPFYGLQPVIADFDGDGLPDIFVANDSTPNYLFHNAGGLRFQEIGLPAGVAVNMDGREQASMGVDVGDYDNDGRLDLIVTEFSEDTNSLYRNRGDGTFEDASWQSRIGPPSWLFLKWGVKFFDFDNDGRLDVIVANGHVYPEADRFPGGSTYRQRLLLHHNLGNGVFAEIGSSIPAIAQPGTARGLAVGDYDGDGAVDVLINQQDAAPRLLHNEARGNHWLNVQLTGRVSNRDGVGAVVTVVTAAGRQTAVRLAGDSYLSSSDPRLHFGLGQEAAAKEVRILWPGGRPQLFSNVKADRVLQAAEP